MNAYAFEIGTIVSPIGRAPIYPKEDQLTLKLAQ